MNEPTTRIIIDGLQGNPHPEYVNNNLVATLRCDQLTIANHDEVSTMSWTFENATITVTAERAYEDHNGIVR